MVNLGVKPSRTLAIFKVIVGIFVIGIAMLFIIMGIPDKLEGMGVAFLAIMGVMSVVSGICEFDLAKRERKT